ncbi:Spy/CpxP family protein refolding chaperone [Phenylobacterium sp. 20VBR1]|uniref:Spy/CpxP family protein refolding chaperone n=1 Tax=Phenylobacterium glaciei TaxID=2803784 RepID=A0A941HUX8_9CAUL|nr:Spy/CpxP family protein refolding chaperone [Phenylobacterium glaciei]MBR7618556.1 Spy/CpxP family protein refolding chaperone [Phenylobacterium glaciei]QQZ50954.1 Spy/CpxP family protein refolding chaperone [Phenylobacterium glaciei]
MSNYAALAAIGLFALAGPAAAQPPGPPPAGMAGMHGMGGMPGMPDPAMMKAHMAEHMAQMDKDMHTILRLRPEQETAWRALRDAMHPADGPDKMMMGPPKASQTTLQRLDEMDRMAAEHQARQAKVAAATRAFYAALSPDQQAVFDALHRTGMMMHGAGGPPMMMHRQMMMMMPGGDGPHD